MRIARYTHSSSLNLFPIRAHDALFENKVAVKSGLARGHHDVRLLGLLIEGKPLHLSKLDLLPLGQGCELSIAVPDGGRPARLVQMEHA